MVTEAQATVQARIVAQQDYDAVVYALRAVNDTHDAHWARQQGFSLRGQVEAGAAVAERLLGKAIYTFDAWELRRAKKIAQEALAAARAAEKTIGGKRQLRLALAA